MSLTLCIGAGPAGLTAAYELVKNQRKVCVLESNPLDVGGIARTIKKERLFFDSGERIVPFKI